MEWLVPECYRRITPNRYWAGYKPEKIEPIEAIIYHYTASLGTSGTLSWLTDPTAKASAHFLVSRDGSYYQMASLAERTWHAGGSTSTLFDKPNVNGRTIGIEIMNVGPLVEIDGKVYSTIDMAREFKGSIAHYTGDKYKYSLWEAYSPTQMDVVCEITRKLLTEFPIVGTEPEIRMIGHEDVDPSRKLDPGGVFNWNQIRDLAV